MASVRNKGRSAETAEAPREPREDYLDAARDCILDLGWRRTTLTEVARRAGVSRMTIYRSWSDMATLLGDLMTREWGTVQATSQSAGEVPHDLPSLTATLVDLVRALRANELFVRIIELDPELLLPYLLARPGRAQGALVRLLTDAVVTGQAAGWIRAGDPEVMARGLVLAGHGFVLSAHTMVDDHTRLPDLDDEFARLLERTLAP